MATIAEFINRIRFKINESDVDKVNDTISQIKNTANNILGAIGVGISLTALNSLVEEFGRVKDQVRNSTAGLGEQSDIQEEILAAATKTRTEYSQTAGVVADLVKESSDLFGSIDEAIKFNNAATMLFKTAGKTNEDIASLMEAINKSFAKGYVDSETISQLLERSPEAVELLNRKLGATSDQLEQLASDGKFTVADLKAAFIDNADAIEAAFGNVRLNVTDAITVIRNKWGLWLADTNEMLEVTQTIGTTMVSAFDGGIRILTRLRTGVVWVSEKLGGMQNLLKFVALAAGAILIAFKMDAIITGIATIIKWIKGLNTQTLLLALKFLIVFLLIEDFINFMQGNNSLLGSLLEKAGIDVDDFREKIINAFVAVRDFLLPLWEGFKDAFGEIFQALSDFWNEWGDEILGGIGTVIGVIGEAIAAVVGWIIDTEDAQAIMYALGQAIGYVAATLAIAIPFIGVVNGAIALLTNPIFLVIAAIIALITIIYLLIENWDAVCAAAQACWEWIKGVWTVVASWFRSNVVDPIINFFVGLYNSIRAVFANIWSSVSSTVGNIKNSIVQGFQSAINWITSLPSQALTWGRDIIDNIVQGIKNSIGNIVNAVSSVASTIKSFLGFSEPETGPLSNFHTYMPDMIDLMTKGIEEGRSRVRDALGSIAGDMSIMVQSGTVSGMTAGSVTSSSVQKSIVQNVQINNEFKGDSAIQQKASTAMKKSGADVTAEMARALAYGK